MGSGAADIAAVRLRFLVIFLIIVGHRLPVLVICVRGLEYLTLRTCGGSSGALFVRVSHCSATGRVGRRSRALHLAFLQVVNSLLHFCFSAQTVQLTCVPVNNSAVWGRKGSAARSSSVRQRRRPTCLIRTGSAGQRGACRGVLAGVRCRWQGKHHHPLAPEPPSRTLRRSRSAT
jgi:hypothetical protein